MKAREETVSSRIEQNRSGAREIVFALAVIILCGAGAIMLVRWMELRRTTQTAEMLRGATDEELYADADFVRSIVPPAFRGLVADYYWMRSLQYVGRKTLQREGTIQLDDLREFNLRLLAPLLETATTLDPQFMTVYEYGAVVLPVVDAEAGIKLLRKGIERNPRAWRLHHHLGYIFWRQGRFSEASAAYRDGAQIAGAPRWMSVMAAQMEAEGGSRRTAREMFRRILEESDDEQVKLNAARRLLWLQSLDDRDLIRRALVESRARTNRCPAEWMEVAGELRRLNLRLDARGTPLDPSGAAYILTNDGCDVGLNRESEISDR
jgi:tetratricopeptide (TPR) repeat protein